MPAPALIFEFEGVLADTALARRAALRASFADEAIALTDATFAAHCHGLPAREAVERLVAMEQLPLDATAAELVALRADRLFADRAAPGLSLQPGAYPLLGELAGRARLAIVTRATRRTVEFVLALAGLEHAFETIVASDDLRDQKPSPAGYHLALDRLARRGAVEPGLVIAFEDSGPGIAAAVAAGVRCIAVGPLAAWQRMGADAALDSLSGVTLETITRLATKPTETAG